VGSFTLGHFTPGERGSQSRSGRGGEENPWWESNPGHPISSLFTTLTEKRTYWYIGRK